MSETENPAEVLREAAALMRLRAEAAVCVISITGDEVPWHSEASLEDGWDQEDAAHIAGMSPTVALAVADWLESEAESIDTTELWFHPDDGVPIQEDMDFMFKNALNVARTYLGRP